MVRSMLKGFFFPNQYWVEAISCSVYILNRAPTKRVKDMCAYEAWNGRKPDVSHFCVFYCIAYAHIHDHIRRNLVNKSENCVFIGYNEQSKAYRLYNLVTSFFFVSKDVQFQEDKVGMPKWLAVSFHQHK
jgi:hypothetical protein